MRAMMIVCLGVLFGTLTAACGGETIRYGAEPTPEPTLVVLMVDAQDVFRDAGVSEWTIADLEDLSRPATVIDSFRLEPFRMDGSFDSYDAVDAELRQWSEAVLDGATSRAELWAICRGHQSPDDPAPDAQRAASREGRVLTLCTEVLAAPYSRTLREWADLIEADINWPVTIR